MIYILGDELGFPHPDLANEDGLLCVGGDLSPERLKLAYQNGIFPWSDEPAMWFCPDPRAVLDLTNYKPSKSLKRTLKTQKFTITFDQEFQAVMELCADTREDTWISDEFIESYTELHEEGLAHSMEIYLGDDLVGGMYGLSFGTAFMGESMFHLVRDASKVAFAALAYQLKDWGFSLLDCQVSNEHLLSLGCEEIPRAAYLLQLAQALKNDTKMEPWVYDPKSLLK